MVASRISSKRKGGAKILLAVAVAIAMLLVYVWLGESLSLENFAAKEEQLRNLQRRQPLLVYLLAFALYVLITGLSLPGATILSLIYSWYFQFWRALVLISFASTAGATLAFLLSRYLFRDFFQRRFSAQLKKVDENIQRHGTKGIRRNENR